MREIKSQSPAPLGLGSILGTALIASGALLAMEAILTALFTGQSGWKPFWTVVAIFMGPVVLHWPAVFDFGAISAAWTAVFIVSIGYAAILGWVLLPWNWGRAVAVGAVFGVFFYFINLFGFAAVFPWLASERNWVTLASHVGFGAVAAWNLKRLRRQI